MRAIQQVWLQGRTKLVLACLALAVSAVFPLGAGAAPNDPFTPRLSVCTSVSPCEVVDNYYSTPPSTAVLDGTTKAGTHPDLAIGIEKTISHCPGYVQNCFLDELYIEQDLKRVKIQLPPGLAADASAAPYCDAYRGMISAPGETEQYLGWKCRNSESVVGRVDIVTAGCSPNYVDGSGRDTAFCLTNSPPLPPGAGLAGPGVIYNERPQPGEQGHLIILWMGVPDQPGNFFNFIRSDVSITVRETDAGIDAIADNIPDVVPIPSGSGRIYYFSAQISEMMMRLFGSKGAEKGHPLLTNPSFCGGQSIDVEFQGYAQNPADLPLGDGGIAQNGQGEGKTVPDSAPYQATNCDALPYSPAFTASTDTDAPGSPVALSTVITQKDDEATTKRVEVEFPQGMGINLKSSLKPCGADKPDRSSCPDSVMGSVEAFSRLLPIGETLKGDVFLTGLKGNKLSLSVLLNGFIDLRLDATAGVDPSGRLTASFDDLPSVPLSKFTLNLAGADRSLVTNPRRCGDNTTKATFTSHSGKVHTVESKSQIKGCSNPEFDVELSEPAKGKRTGIELEVSSDQKPIKEIKFGLDRHIKLSSKGLGKKRKFGEVSVTTATGSEEASLKRPVGVKQKRKKAFSLKVSVLKGLGVNIYRKAYKSKRKAPFKKKGPKKSRKVIKNRVSVKPLPKNDTSKVSVSLNPDETKLLRNPRNKCSANFIALVKTTDGVKHTLKKKLKLRGKGCGKKKVKKK